MLLSCVLKLAAEQLYRDYKSCTTTAPFPQTTPTTTTTTRQPPPPPSPYTLCPSTCRDQQLWDRQQALLDRMQQQWDQERQVRPPLGQRFYQNKA